MSPEELCKRYLSALNESNLKSVLALFEPKAIVVSPLYGVIEAENVYRELFADTNRSVTKRLNIFNSRNSPLSMTPRPFGPTSRRFERPTKFPMTCALR
jgi:hypothetical protein